jgi:hypothetical protein
MITDVRWIVREVEDYLDGLSYATRRKERVLQACDGHVWFDVPEVSLDNPATKEVTD